MTNRFLAKLNNNGGKVLVSDGAMGTMLFANRNVESKIPDEVNLTAPDVVQAVHAAYVEAGSDIIETNTFGATRLKLERTGLADRVREINLAAVKNARAAAKDTTLIAGSMGPVGQLIAPMGKRKYEDVVAAYKEQAEALAEGGVDFFLTETMFDLNEVKAAVEGIRSVCDLPIVSTLTFDKNQHTMMGVSPARAAKTFVEWGIAGFGSNCGTGPVEMVPVATALIENAPNSVIVIQANAGNPRLDENRQPVYDLTPEEFAQYALRYRDLGVRIIGGCCGTTPAHIKAVVTALR
jgi:5-methyltetrahydrofolate--homocysteine methyltransferase